MSESGDYDYVKECVLKVCELTPEYYRNKFRRYRKFDNQSYVEYSHSITRLHDKWYKASGVTDLEGYRELILLEKFLSGIPFDVQKYLLEKGHNFAKSNLAC